MFFVGLDRHWRVLFLNMGIIFAFIDVVMTCNYSPFCIINKTRRTPQCASAIGQSVHFGMFALFMSWPKKHGLGRSYLRVTHPC